MIHNFFIRRGGVVEPMIHNFNNRRLLYQSRRPSPQSVEVVLWFRSRNPSTHQMCVTRGHRISLALDKLIMWHRFFSIVWSVGSSIHLSSWKEFENIQKHFLKNFLQVKKQTPYTLLLLETWLLPLRSWPCKEWSNTSLSLKNVSHIDFLESHGK